MMQQIEAATGRLDVVVNNAFAPYRFDPDQRQRFWETSGPLTRRSLMAQ